MVQTYWLWLPFFLETSTETPVFFSLEVQNKWHLYTFLGASLVAQMVKNLPAVHKTWVWSLGRKDPLKKGWLLTPVFLPGKSHGQRSLAGYGQWNCRESDTTEQLTLSWASLVAQMVKNLLAMWETWVRPQGWEENQMRHPSLFLRSLKLVTSL